MEKTLRSLFDFQKFEGNPALQQVIDSVHARYAVRELSMDDMDRVAAAGTPDLAGGRKDKDADRQS